MKRRSTGTRSLCWLPALPLMLLGGCDDEDSSTGEELTLDNCATSIAGEASAFYQNYRCVTITTRSDAVTIRTVALPPHKTYYYGEDSANYTDWDGGPGTGPNQGTVVEGDLSITIPNDPTPRGLTITGELVDGMAGTSDYEYPGGDGVALDGVPMYAGFAAAGDDLAQEAKGFDGYSGHPDFDNLYHYHGSTKGPLEVLARADIVSSTTPGSAEVEVYGIMCDGTVLLGCTEADGEAPDTSGLDAQGGHVHDIVGPDGTTWFTGRYHTHICSTTHIYAPEIQYYEECERAR